MGYSPWSCKELDMPEHECTSGMGIICISVLIPFPNEENGSGYQSWDAAGLTGAMGRGGTTEEITYPLLPSAPTKPEPPSNQSTHLSLPARSQRKPLVLLIQGCAFRDFPGGPVVKNPHFQCRGTGLISVQEVRSHRPHYTAKKKKDAFRHHLHLWQQTVKERVF